MQEEQDTCRICSAPAESGQPLFYPCKCSGTIRYIHQDCLTTWLAHSKKKTCDVCKHPYSFTKVYAADMPTRLPLILVIRRLAQQAALGLLFAFRAVMVGSIWLAFLPWATVWTWRMYFTMGESTAWWISSRPRPGGASSEDLHSIRNDTLHSISPANSTFITALLSHPTVRNVSADIVTGQIIASLIVLGFVAVFLLREWISQNARPGVFDEAAAPPEMADIPPAIAPLPEIIAPALEPPQPIEPRIFDNPIQVPLPTPPKEDLPIPSPIGATKGDSRNGEKRKLRRVEDEDLRVPHEIRRRDKGKRVASPESASDPTPTSPGQRHPWEEPSGTSSGLDLRPEQTTFTFRAPLPKHVDEDSPKAYNFRKDIGFGTDKSYPEQAVAEGLVDSTSVPDSSFASTSHVGASSAGPSSSASDSSGHVAIRRPPLPSITLPPDSGFTSPSTRSSTKTSPLASPSLATYHAPEELEPGPSDLSGYFKPIVKREPELGQDADSEMDDEAMRKEHEFFFHDPGADADAEESEGDEDEEQTMVDDTRDDGDAPVLPWSDEDFEEEEDEDEELVVRFDDVEGVEEDEGELNEGQIDGLGDQQQQQPRLDMDALDPEDLDANMEDDMDGALEAIGLRGPIFGVLQNAALMIFVLDITIGIGVWLPFTMGKSVALLSLDPRRFLQVIHWPIRVIRFVTDPLVDLVLYIISKTMLPLFIRALQAVGNSLLRLVALAFGQDLTIKGVNLSTTLYNRTVAAVNFALEQGTVYLASTATEAPVTPEPSLLERIADWDSPIWGYLEPYFAPIGHAVRIALTDFKETWTRLAEGDTTSSRIFAIAVGYAVDALLLAIYLNILTVGSVKSAGRAVRSAVRQQLLVVKVAAFIIVELVVFPLGCGVMLDACTVWLFPQGSFRSRTAFLMFAPLTSAFYHWVIGTMFMYQFAILLAGCRGIMRPGAMWFIKDPQDQNFHPIRDILERPTLIQIRKLLLSALMYGLVVACGVATVSGILRIFSSTIMPFRWKIREPLSTVPVDLLFLHVVMPYTMHYFKPKRALHKFGIHLWRYLASQLRLTSYMFGDRHASEEFTSKRWNWRKFFVAPGGIQMDDAEAIHDGTFRRVPNSDNIALVKGERATVQVDENGAPVNEEEARVMHLQDQEALKAKRTIKDDFTIIYLPPHVRYRISLFILALWIVGSVLLAGTLAGPILVGRGFFRLFYSNHVHDGYSFLVGFYLLWGCWLVGHAVGKMDRRRQRRGGDEPRARLPLYVAKRGLLWLAQVSYLAIFLGFVIPTLIALVMELYIILPLRYSLDPDLQPRIRIVDMWALGVVYTKIALRAQRLQGDGPLARGIDHLQRVGWNHPDPFRLTKNIIAPMVCGLLALIMFPPLVLWSIRQLFQLPLPENALFVRVYPTIFTVAGLFHGAMAVSGLVGIWSQGVRDKEFLVEMRLQNLEPDQEKKTADSVSPTSSTEET
ncbi:hypothetical protein C8Q75DRAFT_879244 [Abortiporus biennis]|nr:hypothetical protein C8Q75DRAFT_879244 [Abortiporus biennis]